MYTERVFVSMYVCMWRHTHSQSHTFPHTCLRHSVNDDYDDTVYLSVKVEKGRQRLNEFSVRACREPRRSQEERGSEEDGERGRGVNSTLCGE